MYGVQTDGVAWMDNGSDNLSKVPKWLSRSTSIRLIEMDLCNSTIWYWLKGNPVTGLLVKNTELSDSF